MINEYGERKRDLNNIIVDDDGVIFDPETMVAENTKCTANDEFPSCANCIFQDGSLEECEDICGPGHGWRTYTRISVHFHKKDLYKIT